jgi:hypothetical protein
LNRIANGQLIGAAGIGLIAMNSNQIIMLFLSICFVCVGIAGHDFTLDIFGFVGPYRKTFEEFPVYPWLGRIIFAVIGGCLLFFALRPVF